MRRRSGLSTGTSSYRAAAVFLTTYLNFHREDEHQHTTNYTSVPSETSTKANSFVAALSFSAEKMKTKTTARSKKRNK
eukprot:GSA120T00013828001.1